MRAMSPLKELRAGAELDLGFDSSRTCLEMQNRHDAANRDSGPWLGIPSQT